LQPARLIVGSASKISLKWLEIQFFLNFHKLKFLVTYAVCAKRH